MTVRMKTLAGVALALAMFGGQSAAKADAALESRNDGWRALAPIGWALDEWQDAVDRFGDLVESLPQPADIVCETVGRINPVVSLQCAYWDWVNDHLNGDDDDDDDSDSDSDERDSRGNRDDDDDSDDRGSRGGKSSNGKSNGGSRQSDSDDDDDEAGI